MVNNEDIAYCGLNCDECKQWFSKVGKAIQQVNEILQERNFDEISKAIPFMKIKYLGYKKISNFFLGETCPGCRDGGGNPFCKIRKCARKNSFSTCAECSDIYCKKFEGLLKIHNDGKIQSLIEGIQQDGLDNYVKKMK